MNVTDFIAEFRLQRKDVIAPYAWTDAEIVSYLNSALNEACERALLIEDRTTAVCCEITLVNGQADYALNGSVIKVKRVTYAGIKLEESSVESLDNEIAFKIDNRYSNLSGQQWEIQTGVPKCYFITGQSLRLVPIPTAATILITPKIYLTVYRTLLTPLSTAAPTVAPEIPTFYHLRLMPWIYRCALLKQDSDRFDKAKADEQEMIFIESFGYRPDANVQRKRRDKRLPVTRMIW